MRVLHLPYNIASQITITVRALRDIGVQARGLAQPGVIISNDVVEHLTGKPRSQPLQWVAANLRKYALILQAIRWADVVHWHYGWSVRNGLDLRLARLLKKKRVVEFWGSDIRIPEIEASDNLFYAQVMDHNECSDAESFAESRKRQQQFSTVGATAVICCKSMLPYIQQDLLADVRFVRQRIFLADYPPHFPDPKNPRPLILHSPSAPIIKGTPAVQAAVDKLRSTHSFEFRLVQGMPHYQAKQLMQECDVYVDQLILGAHGVAAVEAMACGKPVVCYIKPSMINQYPPDLPIVSATKETLPEVLARLIEDGAYRHELGQRGRAYVEKYHDAHLLARQLVDIYKSI